MPEPTRHAADAALLTAAMRAAGYDSLPPFAREVLHVTPRSAQIWAKGGRPLAGPVAQLCRALLRRPGLARELATATDG